MGIQGEMEDALNRQINAELYSSYLYMSMAAYFTTKGLPGCAQWMHVQAQEEVSHAMKMYTYLQDRGGRVRLDGIKAPPIEWDSPVAAFEAALDHERHVTSSIHGILELSQNLKDHATSSFLQWFVDEQVEEEASAEDIVQRFRTAGDAPGGIFMIDKELGARQGLYTQQKGTEE